MRRWGWLLLACLMAGAGISVWLGQDANYDLQAYHLSNGASLLQGRFSQDLAPAGMQSYFNPLLDALYAWLALGPLRHAPRLLAATQGLWYGAALFLTARIAALLYPGRPLLGATATLLAITGAAMVTQIGTTFGEIPAAVFMLGGLLALLRGPHSAVAGALFGVAAGLKLTACAFAAPALLAACLLQPRIRTALVFSAAWCIGFAIIDGWWAWLLWQRFGSPVFPMFNGLFHTPWYPPANFSDDRFKPGSLLRALIYPVLWLTGPATQISEIPLRDPRGAAMLCLGVLSLVIRRNALSPKARALCLFLATGYALWVETSGILRYAAVLEVITGLLIPLLAVRLLPRRAATPITLALAAVIMLTTRYGTWGRVAYGNSVLQGDLTWVQPGTLVIDEAWALTAQFVPLLPRQTQIIGLDYMLLDARGWRLHDQAVAAIAAHPGRILVLTYVSPGKPAYELAEIGLNPMLTECRPIHSSFVASGALGPFACVAQTQPIPTLPSPFWHQAAAHYRTLIEPRDEAMTLFGATYLASAGPAARGTRILDWTDLLWRGVSPQPVFGTAPIERGALYILAPEMVSTAQAHIDPAHDALGKIDGVTVLAPGWRDCTVCLQPAP